MAGHGLQSVPFIGCAEHLRQLEGVAEIGLDEGLCTSREKQ
jgi:hypothetical protein